MSFCYRKRVLLLYFVARITFLCIYVLTHWKWWILWMKWDAFCWIMIQVCLLSHCCAVQIWWFSVTNQCWTVKISFQLFAKSISKRTVLKCFTFEWYPVSPENTECCAANLQWYKWPWPCSERVLAELFIFSLCNCTHNS